MLKIEHFPFHCQKCCYNFLYTCLINMIFLGEGVTLLTSEFLDLVTAGEPKREDRRMSCVKDDTRSDRLQKHPTGPFLLAVTILIVGRGKRSGGLRVGMGRRILEPRTHTGHKTSPVSIKRNISILLVLICNKNGLT